MNETEPEPAVHKAWQAPALLQLLMKQAVFYESSSIGNVSFRVILLFGGKLRRILLRYRKFIMI